jgi:asparagine synthetase B (glutamine-hydrolysing)
LIARLARYARDGNGTLAGAFLRRRSIFSPELKERAYSADFLAYAERRGWPHMHRAAAAGPGRPGELLDFDTRYYLPGDILPKVDRTSMHHGLEVRVPFLDHRVVEHVVRLPAEQRYARGPKCLLKDAVATLLPRTVLSKPKQGFGIPIDHYLTGRFWEFLCDHVLDGGPVAAGFVDRVKAERLVREQREGLADWSMQLWCLLVAGLWWELQRERGRNAATNDLDYEKAGVEAARSVSIQ